MQNIVTRFIKDESGATAIEYGLIAALISVALIAGASALGDGINDKFTEVSDALDAAETNTGGAGAGAGAGEGAGEGAGTTP